MNPVCGDEVKVSLRFENGHIADAAVLSRGCAISVASGSMLAELLVGKTREEVERLGYGVKQAGVVLKYVLQARDRGVAVIFITHNPHHAYPVGDRFVILNRGQSLGAFEKSEIDRQELVRLMAGGKELAELEHELEAIKVEI